MATPKTPINTDSNDISPTAASVLGGAAGDTCAETDDAANTRQTAKTRAIFWQAISVLWKKPVSD